MLTRRQEEIVVGSLRDAAAEMIATRERAVLLEDPGDVGETWRALLQEPRTRQRGACPAAHRFGIAEVDGVIFRVEAIKYNVVQAALTGPKTFGTPANAEEIAVLGDNVHAARPFGHQYPAIGEECECPGWSRPFAKVSIMMLPADEGKLAHRLSGAGHQKARCHQ